MPSGISPEHIQDAGDYGGGGRIKLIMRKDPRHSFITMVHPQTATIAPCKVFNLDDQADHEAAGFIPVKKYLSDDPNAEQVEFWPEKRELLAANPALGTKAEKPPKRGITPELSKIIADIKAGNKKRMDFWAATTPKGSSERNIAAAAAGAAAAAAVQAAQAHQPERKSKKSED